MVLTHHTHTNAPLARIILYEGKKDNKIVKIALKVISVPLALFHPPIYAPRDTIASLKLNTNFNSHANRVNINQCMDRLHQLIAFLAHLATTVKKEAITQ